MVWSVKLYVETTIMPELAVQVCDGHQYDGQPGIRRSGQCVSSETQLTWSAFPLNTTCESGNRKVATAHVPIKQAIKE